MATSTTLTGVLTDTITGVQYDVITTTSPHVVPVPPPPVVPPPPPAVVESPDNTAVTNTTSSLIDASLVKWMITAAGKCLVGTVLDTTTANVVGILLHSHKVYHWNASGNWYLRAVGQNPPWTNVAGDPRAVTPPPPPPVVPPPPPTPTPIFDDEFSSFSPPTKWGYCSPDSLLGRAGPNFGETTNQWWLAADNPKTPISGVYAVSNGELVLGVVSTPPAYRAYINDLAGATVDNYTGVLLYSNIQKRLYGYWEVKVSVDAVPGMVFQACLETLQAGWPPEIDIALWTNSDNSQHVLMQTNAWPTSGNQVWRSSSYNITASNKYAVNWQTDFVTFYINDVQVAQFPNMGGVYRSSPCGMYLVTGSGYYYPDVPINPASLPTHARVDWVKMWPSKPGS